ncbi:MAG: hypothetical protein V7717_05335 [Porticoccaceae bacterium]
MSNTNENEIENEIESYEGDSKVDRIVKFTIANTRLGTDKDVRAYAVISSALGNPVALRLTGKDFRHWLRLQAYQHQDILKSEDIAEVVDILSAHAQFKGDEMCVWQRVAPLPTGGIELDIADTNNTRIRVEPGSTTIIESGSDILFGRSSSTQALPLPSEESDLEALLPFLNVSKHEQLLLVAWMTYTLSHPRENHVSYPLLIVKGGQGSGKSFMCKTILRALIDPNANGIQIFPKEPKDMAISSLNAFLLIYDNTRKLSYQWSDALCVAATSGVLASRALYTDCDESVVKFHTPIVLNGIHDFIQEPDLASRCVNIQLLTIPPGQRQHEKDIAANFQLLLPSIFRGLLDLIAEIFTVLDSVEVMHTQRMMGYVKWLAAMETVLALQPGELQENYGDNLKQAMLDMIEEDDLTQAVLTFAQRRESQKWTGTPAALLTELEKLPSFNVINNGRLWPQNAIALSKRLGVLQGPLSSQGVEMQLGVRGKHRRIVLGMRSP